MNRAGLCTQRSGSSLILKTFGLVKKINAAKTKKLFHEVKKLWSIILSVTNGCAQERITNKKIDKNKLRKHIIFFFI